MGKISETRRRAEQTQKQLNNLKPGVKKRSSKPIEISIETGTREPFLFKLTRKLAQLDKSIKGKNLSLQGDMTKIAKRNFRASIRRPAESGENQDHRMTGKFTFGTEGAFKSVLILEENSKTNVIGFGYPDIQRADARTKFVWRSLEFGLGPRGSGHPEGPKGRAMLPAVFGFTTGNPATAKMVVRGPAVSSGARYLYTTGKDRGTLARRGGGFRRVNPQGIAPKYFITGAIAEMRGRAGKEYRKAAAETYRSS